MKNYSWKRREKKVAGVCSTLGDVFNVDPTILRIAFVAFALVVSVKFALIGYVASGVWLHFKKRDAERTLGGKQRTEFDRMADAGKVRPSVHALLHQIDATDRRMMAIDDHLTKPNDALAREIEALREDR